MITKEAFLGLDLNYEFNYNVKDDDAKGTLEIQYYYVDKRTNKQSNLITKKIKNLDDLKTRNVRNEQQRINEEFEKYSINDMLHVRKEEKLFSEIKKEDFSISLDQAELVIDKLTFYNKKDPYLYVGYYFRSLKEGYENLKTETKYVYIYGFKKQNYYDRDLEIKNQEDLDSILSSIYIDIEDKNPFTKSSRYSSQVKDLKDLNINNENENVVVKIKQIIPDEIDGELNIEVYLEDKRTKKTSIKTKFYKISGYKKFEINDESKEKKRLNGLGKNSIKHFSLKNEYSYKKLPSEITKEDFNIYKDNNSEVEIIGFSDVNDYKGWLWVKFKVKSKQYKFKNVYSKEYGFWFYTPYNASNYLDDTKRELEKKINNNSISYSYELYENIDKNKENTLPSAIKNKYLNITFSEQKYSLYKIQLYPNDLEGTLRVEFSVNMHDNKLNENIFTYNTISFTISGLLSTKKALKNQEQQIIDSLNKDDDIVILNNIENLDEKNINQITKDDFVINPNKGEKIAKVKLIIISLNINKDSIDFSYYLQKELPNIETIHSEIITKKIKLLSNDEKIIYNMNKLKVPLNSKYIKPGIYTREQVESIFWNTDEAAKMLNIFQFIKENNYILKIKKMSFEKLWYIFDKGNYTIDYRFSLLSKDKKIESKDFEGKISIKTIMTKRNILRNLKSSISFSFKNELNNNYTKLKEQFKKGQAEFNVFFKANIELNERFIFDKELNKNIDYSIVSINEEKNIVIIRGDIHYYGLEFAIDFTYSMSN
ncbi:hypothetical protein DMC14_000260 [Metamycoplasma phocicerebrale]|uniref:Lipoprotein-associated type-17 domain-containing protein n=1 Tax=Metamycoplasma phocicerebrale TaxID=142649 RepID=A0A3Q9VBE5_9BACT|nr:lipoprotein 17-related variable surface protein [Metamycoplasma phocicerebrale]AZZ65244.2 hypothetical protein DMC14_000260 [Metamycoplasma phocicerebrale]